MTLIYIGIVFMTLGNFGTTLCLVANYTGSYTYMCLGFMLVGLTFLSYGTTSMNTKIETMKLKVEDLERKIDITTATL